MALQNLKRPKMKSSKQAPESISPEIKEAIVGLSESELEEYEERAAIMEYDGGLPRAEAERLALEVVLARRRQTEVGNDTTAGISQAALQR